MIWLQPVNVIQFIKCQTLWLPSTDLFSLARYNYSSSKICCRLFAQYVCTKLKKQRGMRFDGVNQFRVLLCEVVETRWPLAGPLRHSCLRCEDCLQQVWSFRERWIWMVWSRRRKEWGARREVIEQNVVAEWVARWEEYTSAVDDWIFAVFDQLRCPRSYSIVEAVSV
jgi:hypothetical protein